MKIDCYGAKEGRKEDKQWHLRYAFVKLVNLYSHIIKTEAEIGVSIRGSGSVFVLFNIATRRSFA